MRTYLLLLTVFAATATILAQPSDDMDRLMTKKRVSCQDIEVNCRYLLPKYLSDGKTDSMRTLLKYWERNCGSTEPWQRFTLIADAEAGLLKQDGFTKTEVWELLRYKRKKEYAVEHPEVKEAVSGNLFFVRREPINDEFDLFTELRAADLARTRTDVVERRLFEFYSGRTDSLFPLLARKEGGAHSLQTSYDSIITDLKGEWEYDMAVITGLMVPTEGLSAVGAHAELGFSVGMKQQRWAGEGVISFRFLPSSRSYIVTKNGVPTTTDYYFGAYIGGHASYDLYQSRTTEFSVLGGIAFEGFDAIAASSSKANDNVSLNSLNINVGAGGRWYPGGDRSQFFTAELRFNAVNFTNPGGTVLSGEEWTVRVAYHFMDDWKYQLLHALGAY